MSPRAAVVQHWGALRSMPECEAPAVCSPAGPESDRLSRHARMMQANPVRVRKLDLLFTLTFVTVHSWRQRFDPCVAGRGVDKSLGPVSQQRPPTGTTSRVHTLERLRSCC